MLEICAPFPAPGLAFPARYERCALEAGYGEGCNKHEFTRRALWLELGFVTTLGFY
jgi:hypothetical protein